MNFSEKCVCYDCVKYESNPPEDDKNYVIDCACDGAADSYIPERCDNCDVKEFCDIYANPELYKIEG